MKPTWLVQNNLGSTGNYESMLSHAFMKQIPFRGEKIRPFTDDVPEDPQGPIVVYGSCGMVRAARKTALARGIFDNSEGFTHAKWRKEYGKNILNYNAHCIDVGMLYGLVRNNPDADKHPIFARSDDDEKTIIGHVTNLKAFCKELIRRVDIEPSQKLVISPVREIYAEYRCFIVAGKVVSASKYGGNGSKLSTDWCKTNTTVDDAIEFANHMAEIYCPHKIFVMDVCETPEGLKIVELNGFNSSGFYDCNIPAIMDAVNVVVQNSS